MAFVVERHQALDVLRGRGPAIRAPRERGQNRPRARIFLRGCLRMAREDLAHAARFFGTLRVERTLNAEEADRRVVLQLRNRVVLERLAIVLPDHVQARTVVGREERRADEARSRFHRDRYFEDAVARVGRHALAQSDALVLEEVRALAVDDDLELLAGNEAADAEILNREFVFAV